MHCPIKIDCWTKVIKYGAQVVKSCWLSTARKYITSSDPGAWRQSIGKLSDPAVYVILIIIYKGFYLESKNGVNLRKPLEENYDRANYSANFCVGNHVFAIYTQVVVENTSKSGKSDGDQKDCNEDIGGNSEFTITIWSCLGFVRSEWEVSKEEDICNKVKKITKEQNVKDIIKARTMEKWPIGETIDLRRGIDRHALEIKKIWDWSVPYQDNKRF